MLTIILNFNVESTTVKSCISEVPVLRTCSSRSGPLHSVFVQQCDVQQPYTNDKNGMLFKLWQFKCDIKTRLFGRAYARSTSLRELVEEASYKLTLRLMFYRSRVRSITTTSSYLCATSSLPGSYKLPSKGFDTLFL